MVSRKQDNFLRMPPPTRAMMAAALILGLASGAAGQILGLGGAGTPGGGPEEAIGFSAQFTPPDGESAGRVFVTATMEPGWHVYSTTQPPGGPLATVITLNLPEGVDRVGPWQVTPPPDEKAEEAFGGMIVESHHGKATWFAPLRFAPGVDPRNAAIPVTVRYQACDPSSCYPPVTVDLMARPGQGVAIDPARVAPAEPGGADAAEGDSQPPADGQPDALMPALPGPQGGSAPTGTQSTGAEQPTSATQSPAKAGDKLPWRPYGTFSQFESLVGSPLNLDQLRENVGKQVEGKSLVSILVLAFFGGLVLNIMPCVLPVIGLKVLSFIDQAGESRSRAFALNLAYAAGLISIFLLLATLAAFAGYGWGELFSMNWFNVAMAAVVFAMALSFLGVWEIPIPGFVGSGKVAKAAEKEGLSGAFSKGVVTTILATPCTGPFMGTALVWAVAQPPATIFAVFLAIGLGMASPYLLIGAFPKLVAWLPKPGMWMETFKQVMGFVLMGTVVYILTFIQSWYVVPTVGLLFAIWAGCWWIARVPPTAPGSRKGSAWLEAGVFVALMWVVMFPGVNDLFSGRFAFPGIYDVMLSRHERSVENAAYAMAARQDVVPEGDNTVLIAFTADWCATCKTLEAQVLDTPEVRELVARNNVVPVKADYTRTPPEVTQLLESLGAKQVPVVAVFPAGNPNEPTGVFHGWYSQQDIIEALERAGPSRRG